MGWDQAVTAIVQAADAANQMAFNYQQADKNRKFQQYMSSTSHQREVEDLKKAGLNPILSVSGGGGASTPSGNAATTGLGNVASTALQAKRLTEEIKNINAQTKKTNTEERILQKNVPIADAQKNVTEIILSPYTQNTAKGALEKLGGYEKGAKGLVPTLIGKAVNSAKSLNQTKNNIFNKVKGIMNTYAPTSK